MARPRVTLIHVEVDASWSSLAWSVLMAAASVLLAVWWVYGE